MDSTQEMKEAHWPVDVLRYSDKKVFETRMERISPTNVQFLFPEEIGSGETVMVRIGYCAKGEKKPIHIKGTTTVSFVCNNGSKFVATMNVENISNKDREILEDYVNARNKIRGAVEENVFCLD